MKNFNIAFFVILLSVVLVMATQSAKSTVVAIQVSNFAFSPANVNVNVGDTVRWEWMSGSHTTTSLTIPDSAALWDEMITSMHVSYEYVVTDTGVYNYKCTPHFGMGMVGAFTAQMVSTGENQLSKGPGGNSTIEYDLFPNPVIDYIVIRIDGQSDMELDIELTNISGKRIFLTRRNVSGNVFMERFNLGELSCGIYIMQVYDRRNNLYFSKKKIIKK